MTQTHAPRTVYKILDPEDWSYFVQNRKYDGSDDDKRDGFIHLSLWEQIAGTLDKHYAHSDKLELVALDSHDLGDALRYETSRGGMDFPHLYTSMTFESVNAHATLERQADGKFTLPPDLDPKFLFKTDD